jgi:uroporphyrinogen III methyltransferase/synthase
LRVDVLAEQPAVDVLAEALAEFGAARRLQFIEAGEPVLKPSQRRPSGRRKA